MLIGKYMYEVQVAATRCAYVAALFSMIGLHVFTGQVEWQLFEDIRGSYVRGALIKYQRN